MDERPQPQGTLQADGVREWLAGQRTAQAVIDRERRRWLAGLDQQAALDLYLALVSLAGAAPRRGPSPVLTAMREATRRLSRGASL